MNDPMPSQYPASFKAAVALEAFHAEESPAEIAQRFGITESEVDAWKTQLIQGASSVFIQSHTSLKVEKAAIESEELTHTIAENSTQGLALMNEHGHCVYANRALLEMTGYSAEELYAAPIHDLIHHHYPDGRPFPRQECPIGRALPENFNVRSHEDLFFRKDGKSFNVLCAASPIFKDGRPVATVLEICDITERKKIETERQQAEAALRAAQKDLEGKVQERTAELLASNQALIKSKAAAERANRAKTDILSNTSHELRTPLNSILLFSQMLAENWDHNLTPKQVQFAQQIYQAGSELLALVNDLLDLAQIEAGYVPSLEIDEVNISAMVQSLREMFHEIASRKNLEFQTHLPPKLPHIKTDARRLYQILKNLLSNAFKFTHEGSVLLSVDYIAKEPGNMLGIKQGIATPHKVVFSIKDTGIGIEDSKLKLIFEAFRQAESGTARQYGGTGLGLAISKELASLMNGHLEVVSEPGKGSTFTLTLNIV